MKTFADLHIHSTCSDGAYSLPMIVEAVEDQNLVAYSVTDHDTLAFYDLEMPETKARLITGVELSTHHKGHDLHLLVYNFDLADPCLRELMDILEQARKERFIRILACVEKQGYLLDREILEQGTPTTSVLAAHLIKKGYFQHKSSVYQKCLNHCSPGYENFPSLTEMLQKLGTRPEQVRILAHPGLFFYKKDRELLELAALGIQGFEVIHPSQCGNLREYYRKFCKTYKLLYTGGSDFHNEKESNFRIGRMGMDQNQWQNLYEASGLSQTRQPQKDLL